MWGFGVCVPGGTGGGDAHDSVFISNRPEHVRTTAWGGTGHSTTYDEQQFTASISPSPPMCIQYFSSRSFCLYAPPSLSPRSPHTVPFYHLSCAPFLRLPPRHSCPPTSAPPPLVLLELLKRNNKRRHLHPRRRGHLRRRGRGSGPISSGGVRLHRRQGGSQGAAASTGRSSRGKGAGKRRARDSTWL